MKHKMLLVEHDFQTIQQIEEIFSIKNHTSIININNVESSIEMVFKDTPDIIIVNKKQPDTSGLDMLGIIKKNSTTSHIPFVILSNSAAEPEDEIRAIEMGADDYIIKPFNSEVFFARISAILRRHLTDDPKEEEILVVGSIELDLSNHIAYLNKKPIELTPKEFALLYLLIKKKNKVLNRVFLSEAIWEREYYDTSRTIDRHVANLRKKLGKEGDRIETLPTIGYRFIAIN